MTRLGCRLSYGEAQEELALMWQVVVSSGAIREATMRHGRIAEQLVAAEIDRIEREGPNPETKPE